MNRLSTLHPLILSGLLWFALFAIIVMTRPLFNTIETRAMSVAWDMHVRGDFVVPSLNFMPYTQKPPLLAWLINAGWSVAGIHDWVGTLVVGLFGFGCVVWIWALARLIWPADSNRARQAVWLAVGSVVLQLFGLLIFYDMMLTFFVLGGITMMLQALHTDKRRYFFGLAIMFGLGGLTKGPVILLHILPLAFLAPAWSPVPRASWGRWYGKLLFSAVLGAAIAFSWAVPAALQGGKDYARWILLQQTTHRVVKAFNHQEPWWYYLAMGPVLLLPWLFIPTLWQKLSLLKTVKTDRTIRFLLCWIIPVFVTFSIISGKQLHYLLPIWPAILLLIAHLYQEPTDLTRRHIMWAFMPFLVLSMAWDVLYVRALHGHYNGMLRDFLDYPVILPCLYMATMVLCFTYAWRRRKLLAPLAFATAFTVIGIYLAGQFSGFDRFSTQSIANALVQQLSVAPHRIVATTTIRYQGDFNYTARLIKPLIILPPDEVRVIDGFFTQHPDGLVITQVRSADALGKYHIVALQPYRSHYFLALIEK